MTDYPELIDTQQLDQHQVELSLLIPANLSHFDGHFELSPVLPGVAQVDFVMFYARTILGLTLSFAGMENLKFQQLIQPNQRVQLALQFKPSNNKLYFRYFSAQGQHASGRIMLSQA